MLGDEGGGSPFAPDAGQRGPPVVPAPWTLGGNGLLSDYEIAKVLGDLEAIYTYEGSYHISSLIVARAITGVYAFV